MAFPRIKKEYFPLSEVESEWKMKESDLLYVVETGKLRLSYRATRLRIEFGEYQEAIPGKTVAVYFGSHIHSGLLDLHASDARTILFRGSAVVKSFHIPPPAFQRVSSPDNHILIYTDELLIRHEEKVRFEAEFDLDQGQEQKILRKMTHNPIFSEIRVDKLTFRLGPLQANVVRFLVEARRGGTPWVPGKTALSKAGSTCFRLADLFKSQPHWRQLIESDRAGLYRIHPDIRID